MKKVLITICLLMLSVLGYSENFKGTDSEFFESFNPNFDTFTKKDGSVFSGKIEVARGATNLPWFNMDIKNGKKDGKVVFYFKDGKVKSVSHYEKGRMTGDYTFYNHDGTVLYKTTLADGNGLIKDYTEDGKLAVETNYLNGVKDGNMISYNVDGTVKEVVYYRDGRVELPPVEEVPVQETINENHNNSNTVNSNKKSVTSDVKIENNKKTK